jgi:hypothetical protein
MTRPLLLATMTVSLIFLLHSGSHAYKLPDTGQTSCYSSSGEDMTCFGTGQDGAFTNNTMSFDDNEDGTVTDNNTGLMWQKLDDGVKYNWYQASGQPHSSLNPFAQKNVCKELILPADNSYNDWRLPTIGELVSIVDYFIPNTNPNPAIDTTFFPGTKTSYSYWASTYSVLGGWNVNYYNGNPNSWFMDTDYYVRCVRGGENTQGFTDNGDGTVTNNGTGLMWQQGEAGKMTWSDALSYCVNQTLASRSGWRLPNIKELQSLCSYYGASPAINTAYFPDAKAEYYWTSTTYRDGFANARHLSFSSGDAGYQGKVNSLNVRCVRTESSSSLRDYLVRILRPGGASFDHPDIQTAYANAGFSGSVIKAQATDLAEELIFDDDIIVAVKGGYNSEFTLNPLKTNLTGNLTIKRGSVTIENIVIK